MLVSVVRGSQTIWRSILESLRDEAALNGGRVSQHRDGDQRAGVEALAYVRWLIAGAVGVAIRVEQYTGRSGGSQRRKCLRECVARDLPLGHVVVAWRRIVHRSTDVHHQLQHRRSAFGLTG